MPRTRLIKPEFWDDDQLAALGPHDRLAFIGLWNFADREGRLKDEPLRLRARIFPYEPTVDFDAALARLADKAYVIRYSDNGDRYLQVRTFMKHQHPHLKEPPSTIPGPYHPSTIQAPTLHQPCTIQAPVETGTSRVDLDLDLDLDPVLDLELLTSAPLRVSAFETFWTAYPRKVSKKDAVRAWAKLAAPDEVLPRILAAIEWQRAGWTDLRYVPFPAQWLNDRRWEDERPPPPATPTPTKTRAVPSAGWGEWTAPESCPHKPPCQTQRSCRTRAELNQRQRLPRTHGWPSP